MPITDTTPEVRELQLKIQRSKSGVDRMLLAYEMSMFVREVARERIRLDHPNWDEAQIARELLRIAFFPKPLPARFS